MHDNKELLNQLKVEIDKLDKKVKETRLKPEDIDLIVDKVCDRIEEKIYKDVGRGILALAWRGILLIIVLVASYGVSGHFWK